MARISEYLKNILLLIVIVQLAPVVVSSVKKHYKAIAEPPAYVGYLKIEGSIEDASLYRAALKKFFENTDIKAILLKIESPGGISGACQGLFYEIGQFKQEHPKSLVVVTENVCASGGYYIAAAADYIVATASAIVGSIGVYIAYPGIDKVLQRFDVDYTIAQAGQYKMAGSPFVPTKPEVFAMLQNLSQDTYRQFTHDVAQKRTKLSLKAVDQWANGRLFTGNQALELGLVDAIGSLSVAIQKIKELEGIEGSIEWIKTPTPGPLAKLFGAEEQGQQESLWAGWVNAICTALEQRYSAVMPVQR